MLIEDGNETFEDETIVEFKFIMNGEKFWQWVPIRVRNDKTLLYAMPNNYFIDGQGDISDPLGMNGIKLELE